MCKKLATTVLLTIVLICQVTADVGATPTSPTADTHKQSGASPGDDSLRRDLEGLQQEIDAINAKLTAALLAKGADKDAILGQSQELDSLKTQSSQLVKKMDASLSGYSLGATVTSSVLGLLFAVVGVGGAATYFGLKKQLQNELNRSHVDLTEAAKVKTSAYVYNRLSTIYYHVYVMLAANPASDEFKAATSMALELSEAALSRVQSMTFSESEPGYDQLKADALNTHAFHLAIWGLNNSGDVMFANRRTKAELMVPELWQYYVSAKEHFEAHKTTGPTRRIKFPLPAWYNLGETYARLVLTYSQNDGEKANASSLLKELCENPKIDARWQSTYARGV